MDALLPVGVGNTEMGHDGTRQSTRSRLKEVAVCGEEASGRWERGGTMLVSGEERLVGWS